MGINNRGTFSDTGPSHLTQVDWNNPNHRRTDSASLVEGVYKMERDRSQNPQVPLAPPWWEFFNFKWIEHLEDDRDHSYFGAKYEYTCGHVSSISRPPPPQYVIAFRGTITKAGNWKQDLELDLHCILNILHKSTRFLNGLHFTLDAIHQAGPGNVWLAGHSLGSSIALLIGRRLIKDYGIHLETYLFNPPCVYPPAGWIPKNLKHGIQIITSIVRAVVATSVNIGEAPSTMLPSKWSPNVFVNPSDPICSGYIGYFKHRETMEARGEGEIERIATKHSLMSIVAGAVRQDDYEVAHFIPCAHLYINSSPTQSIKDIHGLCQWWKQDLEIEYKWCAYN